MKVGDLVKITEEFGKYFFDGKDISGLTGIITEVFNNGCLVLVQNGHCYIEEPYAFLEVINNNNR